MVRLETPTRPHRQPLTREGDLLAALDQAASSVQVHRGPQDTQSFWLALLNAVRNLAPTALGMEPVTAAPGLDAGDIVERVMTGHR